MSIYGMLTPSTAGTAQARDLLKYYGFSFSIRNPKDCLIRPIWRKAFQSMVDIFKDNNLKDILKISEN